LLQRVQLSLLQSFPRIRKCVLVNSLSVFNRNQLKWNWVNSYLSDKAINKDGFRLSNPMSSILSLQIDLRVPVTNKKQLWQPHQEKMKEVEIKKEPVRIVENDRVCRCQIDTESSRSCWQ
jgi:hypothetical protein